MTWKLPDLLEEDESGGGSERHRDAPEVSVALLSLTSTELG